MGKIHEEGDMAFLDKVPKYVCMLTVLLRRLKFINLKVLPVVPEGWSLCQQQHQCHRETC